MVNLAVLSLVLISLSSFPVKGKDLGTHGIVYPITEEDPITVIQSKLKAMEETGEFSLHERTLQKKTKAAVERPTPVARLLKAEKQRVFYYDPSYVVSKDFRDHKGKVFAKKGTKINPLKTVNLSADLLFFDGDDEEQVAWAKAQLQDQNAKVKLILIKGAPLALSEELALPVYFDQDGGLTKKLRIKHIPACVTQAGIFLRIEEICLLPKSPKSGHEYSGSSSPEEKAQ